MESTWLAIHPLSPSDDPGAVRVLAPGLVQSRIVDTHTRDSSGKVTGAVKVAFVRMPTWQDAKATRDRLTASSSHSGEVANVYLDKVSCDARENLKITMTKWQMSTICTHSPLSWKHHGTRTHSHIVTASAHGDDDAVPEMWNAMMALAPGSTSLWLNRTGQADWIRDKGIQMTMPGGQTSQWFLPESVLVFDSKCCADLKGGGNGLCDAAKNHIDLCNNADMHHWASASQCSQHKRDEKSPAQAERGGIAQALRGLEAVNRDCTKEKAVALLMDPEMGAAAAADVLSAVTSQASMCTTTELVVRTRNMVSALLDSKTGFKAGSFTATKAIRDDYLFPARDLLRDLVQEHSMDDDGSAGRGSDRTERQRRRCTQQKPTPLASATKAAQIAKLLKSVAAQLKQTHTPGTGMEACFKTIIDKFLGTSAGCIRYVGSSQLAGPVLASAFHWLPDSPFENWGTDEFRLEGQTYLSEAVRSSLQMASGVVHLHSLVSNSGSDFKWEQPHLWKPGHPIAAFMKNLKQVAKKSNLDGLTNAIACQRKASWLTGQLAAVVDPLHAVQLRMWQKSLDLLFTYARRVQVKNSHLSFLDDLVTLFRENKINVGAPGGESRAAKGGWFARASPRVKVHVHV